MAYPKLFESVRTYHQHHTSLCQNFELNCFILSIQDSDFLHRAIVFDRSIPSKKHELGPPQTIGTLKKYIPLNQKGYILILQSTVSLQPTINLTTYQKLSITLLK